MAYRIVNIPTSLNESFLLHAFTDGIFSYSGAAIDKISTDIVRHAIPTSYAIPELSL